MCQIFEASLVPIYELFKMNVEPGYIEKTHGYVPETAYKNPLRNIVKQLSAKGQIDPTVESRLDRYIDSRHLLVHRWFIQKGWPADDDVDGWKALEIQAIAVRDDAQYLARHFLGYMAENAEPERARANPEEYLKRIEGLFHSRIGN